MCKHLHRLPLRRRPQDLYSYPSPRARAHNVKVICIDVGKRENELNASLTKDSGLEDRITIPGETSYFETGLPDSCCDVVYSQDALVRGGSERHRALSEAARMLKPRGRMVISDFMQSEEADAKDMQEVRGTETV